ncbi:potassium channel family protein [Pontiella agarivorans]|uniref:Potassium channel protein n=1 Tax=Pontiella agarivorans TaxID=3038953 RepID=A0ABU5MSJ3_9BACT|nr:potassium channel protein [Pontiella agarivorans]MDZ8117107.1 potassium channel protein [Pontiella agarivorans]
MHTKLINDQLRAGIRNGGGAILAILIFGTVGYMQLEGWGALDAFYMTVITISTVGITEVHPLSDAGRMFTSLLIFGGVGVMAYSLGRFAEFMFQRSVTNVLGRRSMMKKIASMKQHIIICGYGRTGTRLVSEMMSAGKPFVVIDDNEDAAKRMDQLGIPHIPGDATEEETLEQANLQQAESLVAALGTDADNLFLTLTASGLSSELRIIARVHDPDNTRKFHKAGASRVVSPISTGVNQITQLLTRPYVVDLVELVASDKSIALEVIEHEIGDNSTMLNQSLAEARVRQTLGALVIAVKHNDGTTAFDPGPEMRLRLGDTLVAIRQPDESDQSI